MFEVRKSMVLVMFRGFVRCFIGIVVVICWCCLLLNELMLREFLMKLVLEVMGLIVLMWMFRGVIFEVSLCVIVMIVFFVVL